MIVFLKNFDERNEVYGLPFIRAFFRGGFDAFIQECVKLLTAPDGFFGIHSEFFCGLNQM